MSLLRRYPSSEWLVIAVSLRIDSMYVSYALDGFTLPSCECSEQLCLSPTERFTLPAEPVVTFMGANENTESKNRQLVKQKVFLGSCWAERLLRTSALGVQ